MRIHRPPHFVSLIIPVYRQEKTILTDIKHIKEVLDTIRYDYEIIIVVDGITDKTFQKIKNAHIQKVRCIGYEKNHGKFFAIRLGMKLAKGDYIMFIDSGMEIDPNGISMLLEHMEWYNADIIVGSKRHQVSQVNYPTTRKILSWGYFMLVKRLFGVKIHDTQAGIKVFKKHVIAKVLPRLVEKKFAGDLEILVVSTLLGYDRIYEAPIKLNFRLGSITSAATLHSIGGILMDTLAIYYRRYLLHTYHTRQKIDLSFAKIRFIEA